MQPENKKTAGAVRGLTYGEKVVGISFNPSGDETVGKVKELYAQIIDICHAKRLAGEISPDAVGVLTEAISHALTAQMWAVKGITWKY